MGLLQISESRIEKRLTLETLHQVTLSYVDLLVGLELGNSKRKSLTERFLQLHHQFWKVQENTGKKLNWKNSSLWKILKKSILERLWIEKWRKLRILVNKFRFFKVSCKHTMVSNPWSFFFLNDHLLILLVTFWWFHEAWIQLI